MKKPANPLAMLLLAAAIAFASTDADYSAALQTHFAKGTLGSPGKTRSIEMFFQNVFKSGKVYSVSGKSKTSAAEDVFAGTLTISGIAAGGSCASGETEIKGSYDLNEKESKTSGSFKGTFTACEKNGTLSKANFKGNWVKHANGNKTPCNFELGPSFGSLAYEGQTYKTVKIGSQTWMAENLNYNADGSKCYDNSESNCAKYGRLYNWATANRVCPSGWHLPNASDWDILMNYVQTDNGSTYVSGSVASITGKYLKAMSGWENNGNGEDKYGFAALPGGIDYSDGSINGVGKEGSWWSTSYSGNNFVDVRNMTYFNKSMGSMGYNKNCLISVRCVKD